MSPGDGPGRPSEARATSPGWVANEERGTRLALRFVLWFLRLAGRNGTRVLLYPIAAYYCLFATGARRASRQYLAKLDRATGGDGHEPGLRDVYRHVFSFAEAILDRLAIWGGTTDGYEIEIHGREILARHLDQGRGAFLVGAHLGSFDVLRLIARDADIPVNVIMYVGNAERINDAIEELDPGCKVRVIDFDPTSVRAAFEIRACIQRGEFVAILADRVPVGGRRRVTTVDFLGEPAAFPQGPFLVSLLMRLPIVLTLALKTGRHRYDVHFETISSGAAVPVRDRAKTIDEQIALYAARLEHYCKQAPLQWFNFYDFWAEAQDEQD